MTKEFHSRSLDLYLFEKDRKEGRKEGKRIVFDLLTKDRKGCRAVDQLRAADSARSAVAVAMIPFTSFSMMMNLLAFHMNIVA